MAIVATTRSLLRCPEGASQRSFLVDHPEIVLTGRSIALAGKDFAIVQDDGRLPVAADQSGWGPTDIPMVGREDGPVRQVHNVKAVTTVNQEEKVAATRELARAITGLSE